MLEDWQRRFWNEALELDPVTGLRVYHEIGMGLPRKNGKSTMAAGFGLYGLVADGENEPEVYVGAAAQQQAGIVMGQSLKMARGSPRLWPDYVKVSMYRIEGTRNGGIMRALSSDGALQHGLNPSVSIIDEVHAHKNSDLFTALTTGGGAREQPMTFWITTAGVDEDNLLADLYGQMFSGTGTLETPTPYLSIYRDRPNGVLVWWYGAPNDSDPADPAVWMGVNPASWLQDPVRFGKEYANMLAQGKLLEWQIYHLNQIMSSETEWLPEGVWRDLREGDPHEDRWHGLDPALPVGVGIKKEPASEGAAIVVAQRRGEKVTVRATHFAPESATGRVSVVEMRQTLRDLRARFPVPMMRDPKTRMTVAGPVFAFDPVPFGESAEALEQEGLNMAALGQVASVMAPASTMTYELATTGRLSHDGDPVLARHVADSTAQLTERGMRVMSGKRRPNSACIAMCMAIAVGNVDPPKPYVRKPRTPVGF